MISRLTTGWTFIRAFYGFMGLWVLAQAWIAGEWLFSFFGIYFLAMSVFRLGCAAGYCVPGSGNTTGSSGEIQFDEGKGK